MNLKPWQQTPEQQRRGPQKPLEGIACHNRLTDRAGVVAAEAYGSAILLVHKYRDHHDVLQITPCLEMSLEAARALYQQLGDLLP